jgi:enamine deaminase RidA (YjgF/YER057c/UK114 family)
MSANIKSARTAFSWADLNRAAASPALRTGAQLYLSNITAVDRRGPAVGAAGTAQQTRIIYRKISELLEAAGKSPADIVKLVEYVCVDALEQYQEAAEVRSEFLGSQRVATNTVVVKALPNPDALIAIEVTAGPQEPSPSSEPWLPTFSNSDGIVYLPSVLPLNAEGEVVAPGDLAGQTRVIFENARKVLRLLGMDMDRVVMTTDHPTPEARKSYKDLASIRQEFLGPVYPAAAGIIMPQIACPGALIQYEFTATRDAPVKVNPGWSRYDTLTYSPATRAGRLLFMSGQSARDPATGLMPAQGDVLQQTKLIYEKVATLLEAAGGSCANLVRLVEYVTPRSAAQYLDVGDVRRRAFSEPYPVVTSVICETLLRREMEIEIVPFAILDEAAA